MAVIEHQILEYEKLLSYKCVAENEKIPFMIKSIMTNIDALDLKISGSIILGKHLNEVEFLIPIDRTIGSSKHFSYKAVFKLMNAVRQRHYGSYEKIDESIAMLRQYISDHFLTPVTSPYILVKTLNKKCSTFSLV